MNKNRRVYNNLNSPGVHPIRLIIYIYRILTGGSMTARRHILFYPLDVNAVCGWPLSMAAVHRILVVYFRRMPRILELKCKLIGFSLQIYNGALLDVYLL